MAEKASSHVRPTSKMGRILYSIARILAIFGGTLLFILAILTTVSVVGRSFFQSPIPGDFELISIGTGVAIFAILPYCQMVRGNVIVDFFMTRAPDRAKAFFDMIGTILYTGIAALLTWRMIFGGMEMYQYSEKSMTINFPRWTTFPVSILFLGFLALVCLYTISRSYNEMRAGKIDEDGSADIEALKGRVSRSA